MYLPFNLRRIDCRHIIIQKTAEQGDFVLREHLGL